MKMSRQRKMSLAVVGLAVTALVADKAFFAPAEVAAATDAAEFAVAPTTGDAGAQSQMQALNAGQQSSSVSERLRSFAQQHPLDRNTLSDPFLPAWVDPQGSARAQRLAATDVDTREFARNFRLTAVMGKGSGGYAVINGAVVRIGERVGQFTLVEIGERTAAFRTSDGRIATLTLEEQPR